MSVNLSKGERVNLTKGTGLKVALAGLGWDVNRYQESEKFDLDLSLFLCGADRKCINESHFVFYGNSSDPNGAVKHSGDNLTGEGDGDYESAIITFDKLDTRVEIIVIAVTIYDARIRDQNFGMVDNSYIRVVNHETGEELYCYDLGEDFSTQTSVIFGEMYKHQGEWKFKAVGQGYEKELGDLCLVYGIDVG